MQTASTEPKAVSLTILLSILSRHRALLAFTSLGCAVLFFLVSFLLPNTFKATALVMPPDHSSSTALSMLGSSTNAAISSGALSALNIKNPSDLYVALIQSPVVEDSVIERFDLMSLYGQKLRSRTVKELQSNLQVTADGKTGIISISVIDKSAARAAQMANGFVQAFQSFSSQLAITDAAQRRLFFDRQVEETKAQLAHAEDTLKSTSSRTGVLEPEGTARAMIGYEAQLRAEIATKTVELQSLKVYLSDDNPRVQVASRELQSLRQQADALGEKNGSAYSKKEESGNSLDYMRALRDVRSAESLYEALLKNLELAKLDEAREGNIIQIVSSATPPDTKNGPHRSFFLVGGFLVGLIGGSIWALLAWAREGSGRAEIKA